MVFERNNTYANDRGQGWDGTVNGQLVNPGVYDYMVEIRCLDGSTYPFRGNVTVVK